MLDSACSPERRVGVFTRSERRTQGWGKASEPLEGSGRDPGRALRASQLLASGAPVAHGRGEEALLQAAAHEDPTLVALLLERGAADGPSAPAHPQSKLDGALWVTARQGRVQVLTLLLDRGATVDAEEPGSLGDKGTPLMAAARSGSVAAVRVLLDRGAGLDRPDRFGRTALIHAVREGRTASVALLLDRGAAASIADHDGRTALDHCFASPKAEKQAMWRLLDQKGARGKGYLFGRERSVVFKWGGSTWVCGDSSGARSPACPPS